MAQAVLTSVPAATPALLDKVLCADCGAPIDRWWLAEPAIHCARCRRLLCPTCRRPPRGYALLYELTRDGDGWLCLRDGMMWLRRPLNCPYIHLCATCADPAVWRAPPPVVDS